VHWVLLLHVPSSLELLLKWRAPMPVLALEFFCGSHL
jgi:hypothetical protein